MTREQYIEGCNKGFSLEEFYDYYKENIGKRKLYSFDEFKRAFPIYSSRPNSLARFFLQNNIKFTPTKLILQDGAVIYS